MLIWTGDKVARSVVPPLAGGAAGAVVGWMACRIIDLAVFTFWVVAR